MIVSNNLKRTNQKQTKLVMCPTDMMPHDIVSLFCQSPTEEIVTAGLRFQTKFTDEKYHSFKGTLLRGPKA
jgi:hypothetical protein